MTFVELTLTVALSTFRAELTVANEESDSDKAFAEFTRAVFGDGADDKNVNFAVAEVTGDGVNVIFNAF